jgi:hypothetical protein
MGHASEMQIELENLAVERQRAADLRYALENRAQRIKMLARELNNIALMAGGLSNDADLDLHVARITVKQALAEMERISA